MGNLERPEHLDKDLSILRDSLLSLQAPTVMHGSILQDVKEIFASIFFFNLVELNILFIVCVLILITLCYVQANYLHYFIFFKEKYSTFLEDD